MTANVYEHAAWRESANLSMHPGGLSLSRQALALAGLQPGAYVLDVGCGMAATLAEFSSTQNLRGIGVDVSPRLLSHARGTHPSLRLAAARAENLPFLTGSMDALLSECTLSLFDLPNTLLEWRRLLKQDGKIIINDLYARNPEGADKLRNLPEGSCLNHVMGQAQVMDLVQDCGFKVETWQDSPAGAGLSGACKLAASANIDPFDLYLAAARAKLSYYILIARRM